MRGKVKFSFSLKKRVSKNPGIREKEKWQVGNLFLAKVYHNFNYEETFMHYYAGNFKLLLLIINQGST